MYWTDVGGVKGWTGVKGVRDAKESVDLRSEVVSCEVSCEVSRRCVRQGVASMECSQQGMSSPSCDESLSGSSGRDSCGGCISCGSSRAEASFGSVVSGPAGQ